MAIYEGVQPKTHKEFELTVFCRKEGRNLAAIIGAGKKHKGNLEKGEKTGGIKSFKQTRFSFSGFLRCGWHKSKKFSEADAN